MDRRIESGDKMEKRVSDFLDDFIAMYNAVAKAANWQILSKNSRDDMLGCPFCPWDPHTRDHRRDVRGAEWEKVWPVTEHVFAKHHVKKPKFSGCWSLQNMVDRIEFE